MADPLPIPIDVHIDEGEDKVRVDPKTGTVETDQPDGGVVVAFGAAKRPAKDDDADDKFSENLALVLPQDRLNKIAEELIEAISADDQSRAAHLSNSAYGLDLLGLRMEKPKSTVSDAASPVEGMSSVTNPLLLDAILRGWANTVGELLPAEGPAKIKDVGEETQQHDELAESLERDFNHYLTDVATEYVPDTSHMILWGPYFKGSGFKKVYKCPMRRRPVSESVDSKDLIVSDTMKDLRSCGRITHQILMRPSVMKRMILVGAYAGDDDALQQPMPSPNVVDEKTAAIQGTRALPSRPEDQPYTIWESQCELDLGDDDPLIPKQFKDEGIPLPYLVTIDKDTRKIRALRRDWREDDKDAQRKRMYVRFPYVPGPGFYGTGLLNILGNASAAMTAAWREALDAGMFASFPGGMIAKNEARQNSNMFRVSPGEFAPVETAGKDIRTVAMGMPYRDVTPGLMSMMDRITQQVKALGGAADIPAAEGIQNVPVGTMLAQIEQATKVMAAAHKGMYQAQGEEFDLILDLLRENPEDFWRSNTVCPPDYWTEEKFIQALDTCSLIPRADPNIPSHIHRVTKAIALLQLAAHPKTGPYIDGKETALRCLRALKEDERGLLIDPPAQQNMPDPKLLEAQARIQDSQTKSREADIKATEATSDQAIQGVKLATERYIADKDVEREQLIHGADMVKFAHQQEVDKREAGLIALQTVHDIGQDRRQHNLAERQAAHDQQMDAAGHALDVHQALNPPQPKGGQ